MYEFLKNLHSGWAYIVVLLTAIVFIAIIYHFIKKKPVHSSLRKISFFSVLSFHIQFLIGIGLYFLSPIVQTAWETGTAMKTGPRLFTVEHPFMMFTAVILITIGNSKLKKSKYVKTSTIIFFAISLLCFYMIPWSSWLAS